MAHKSPRAEGSILSSSEFHHASPGASRWYINRQGGVHSGALYRQAACLLLWADHHLLSIRATHVPDCLNSGTDMLSRGGIPHGEWRLDPRTVRIIWERFGKAEVDLFVTEDPTEAVSTVSGGRLGMAPQF